MTEQTFNRRDFNRLATAVVGALATLASPLAREIVSALGDKSEISDDGRIIDWVEIVEGADQVFKKADDPDAWIPSQSNGTHNKFVATELVNRPDDNRIDIVLELGDTFVTTHSYTDKNSLPNSDEGVESVENNLDTQILLSACKRFEYFKKIEVALNVRAKIGQSTPEHGEAKLKAEAIQVESISPIVEFQTNDSAIPTEKEDYVSRATPSLVYMLRITDSDNNHRYYKEISWYTQSNVDIA